MKESEVQKQIAQESNETEPELNINSILRKADLAYGFALLSVASKTDDKIVETQLRNNIYEEFINRGVDLEAIELCHFPTQFPIIEKTRYKQVSENYKADEAHFDRDGNYYLVRNNGYTKIGNGEKQEIKFDLVSDSFQLLKDDQIVLMIKMDNGDHLNLYKQSGDELIFQEELYRETMGDLLDPVVLPEGKIISSDNGAIFEQTTGFPQLVLNELKRDHKFKVSPDNKICTQKILGTIVFDLESRTEKKLDSGPLKDINNPIIKDFSFMKDGRLALLFSGHVLFYKEDKNSWIMDDGFRTGFGTGLINNRGMQVLDDGHLLTFDQNAVCLWRQNSKKKYENYSVIKLSDFADSNSSLQNCYLCPDGKLLLIASDGVNKNCFTLDGEEIKQDV